MVTHLCTRISNAAVPPSLQRPILILQLALPCLPFWERAALRRVFDGEDLLLAWRKGQWEARVSGDSDDATIVSCSRP